MDQLLTTGAIDRALAGLAWPDVAGKALVVQLGVEVRQRAGGAGGVGCR